MAYQYEKSCKCGHTFLMNITKREAAFELRWQEIVNKKCPKCGNADFTDITIPTVELDKALLLEWGNHREYFLMPQDEELLLAEEKYFDMIVDILDSGQILQHKKYILLEALCVLLYDLVQEEYDTPFTDALIRELNKRRADINTSYIMDYIKEVVFPVLERNQSLQG